MKRKRKCLRRRAQPWMPRLARHMFAVPGREDRARPKGKVRTMKHITGTALTVAAFIVVAVTGVALLAGNDDIRKFHRMHCM